MSLTTSLIVRPLEEVADGDGDGETVGEGDGLGDTLGEGDGVGDAETPIEIAFVKVLFDVLLSENRFTSLTLASTE
jgi:hypothetical protein